MRHLVSRLRYALPLGVLCTSVAFTASATDKALLDILFGNGLITEAQYAQLMQQETVSSAEVLSSVSLAPAPTASSAGEVREEELASSVALDENVQRAIDDAVANAVMAESPIEASYGSKGFRFETRDGNWQTNLQWRAQMRYSNPYGSDPRQIANYEDSSGSSFEQRRLRMKIGGHGFKPWIKYYFEVDLQPARDVDADPISSGARVID